MRERTLFLLVVILLVFACLAGLAIAREVSTIAGDWACKIAGSCP